MDVKRVAVATVALLLAACTSPGENAPSAERAATTALKDALIASAVKAALISDDPDSTTTVGVSVRDGVVTLRGHVRDAKTHQRFVADARKTNGVRRVVDELRVDPNAPRLRQQVGDVALAARVQTAITAQVGIQNITVHVHRGVAELDGTVHDAKTRTTIEATARGTSGIRNVVDRIRVARP